MKTGAFGQYFIGYMRDLSLINYPQGDLNIYTLTEWEKKLANTLAEKEKYRFSSY